MSVDALKNILSSLEARIDLEHIQTLAERHTRALYYQPVDRLPLSLYVPYDNPAVATYSVREAMDHPAKMMVNQLLEGFSSIVHLVDLKTDTPLCLRANMGVTIIASMFGAQIETRGNEPPWVRPWESLDAIRAIVEAPLPDLDSGLLPRTLEHYAFFRETLAAYPKCAAAIQLTLPDLQGPFDIAELLWGSDIFVALYDHPDLVRAFLDKITDTILAVYHYLINAIREDIRPECQYQHMTGVKGKLLIRSDTSVIMISPAMYAEHVRPHDVRLAEELDGVGVHFCGDGSQQIENLVTMPGLQSLDFGQSFLMDMDAIYAQARAREIALTRLQLPDDILTAEAAQRRFPTGVNLMREVASVAEAEHVWAQYTGTK